MEPTFKKAPPGAFDTPFKKLLPLAPNKQNICLVLSGSFFPLHNNHLRTLEKVKEEIDKAHPEYNIIGGYIMPTHNTNLQKKLGNMFIPPIKRLEMYQLAIADSDWIDVDPYLLMQPKNIGMEQARIHLENLLIEKYTSRDEDGNEVKPKSIKAISVMGVDNIPLVEKRIAKDLFIFVQNRPSLSHFEAVKWLESDKVKPYQHNVILVKDEEIPYELSSTILRDMICKGESVDQYLPAKLSEFFKNDFTFQKVFKSLQQKAKNKENDGESALIAELEHFGLDGTVVKENLKEHVEFPFNQIEWKELVPELTFGQPTKLGRGVAAAVWAMKWNDIPVAVKIFNISSQKNRRIGSFKLELRALQRINSKYVVKCLGAGSVANGVFIVLERAETTNIWSYVTDNAEMWHRKGYSLAWIKAWANLAEGCDAMSRAGILHRDLQLDNILLFKESSQEEEKSEEENNKEEKVIFKVSDFGVSSTEEDKDKVIRGSIRHYSPEAIEEKNNYSPAADVYSFGLLLHEMIHGKRVYSLNPTSEVTVKVIAGERPDFEVPCHVRIQDIIKACWAQKPEDRPSFGEVAQMLRNAYNELKIETSSHSKK